MGNVILLNGSSVWIDELSGTVNLGHMIENMRNDDYTASFRISTISALGKLGKSAESAISYLKELADTKSEVAYGKLIADAALQAIRKIEEGKPIEKKNFGGYNHSRHSESTSNRPDVFKVTFEEIDSKVLNEGLRYYCQCNFCEKLSEVNPYHRSFSDKLVGGNKYFCSFCIRNDYYHRCNTNVMVLTYRGLIGYYYYAYYVIPRSSTMYMAEIQEYIDLHVKAGMQNPAFKYDPDTFCWFIDFTKVGKKKIPIESVLKTVIEQLACFNLYENVRAVSPMKFYDKYKNAINEFASNRTRVDGRVFAPTLLDCGIPKVAYMGRTIPIDSLTGFSPGSMIDNAYNKANSRR